MLKCPTNLGIKKYPRVRDEKFVRSSFPQNKQGFTPAPLLFPEFAGLLIEAIRTMFTPTLATISAFQMICFSENNEPFF
jgi:hypothetical protein